MTICVGDGWEEVCRAFLPSAALGFGLAILSVIIRVERLAFEVAVILVVLAALGLTRLVIGLRKY